MADDPTEVRDWIHFGIYVLCTVIQTVVGSIVVFCWNQRNRVQDQKEEKRKKEEEKRKEDENKQRADAEKIIAILTKNYYGAVEKFQILKEHVDVLKNKKIVTGPLATDTFTEFDVLLYMYHRDKFDVMTSPVGQAVTEIMKLFEAFALRLPTMHRACPDNIRSEFSTEIKKMGEIVYSFVTRAGQEPIERVFEYLDPTDSLHATYPGHDVIQRAIPYIEHFRYKNGEMNCNIECKDSHIKCLETCVKEGVSGVIAKDMEIRNHIIELWPQQPSESDQLLQQSSESDQSPQQPSESEQLPQQSSESEQLPDLLHLVRMVMFKLLDDDRSGLFGEEQLKTFSEQVKAIVNSPENHDKKKLDKECKRALDGIVICAQYLCRHNYKPMREDTAARDFLNNQWKRLQDFGTEMVEKHNITVGTLT